MIFLIIRCHCLHCREIFEVLKIHCLDEFRIFFELFGNAYGDDFNARRRLEWRVFRYRRWWYLVIGLIGPCTVILGCGACDCVHSQVHAQTIVLVRIARSLPCFIPTLNTFWYIRTIPSLQIRELTGDGVQQIRQLL